MECRRQRLFNFRRLGFVGHPLHIDLHESPRA
jgi:hypothetical protein